MADRFRSLPTANLSDSMSRLYAGGTRLCSMHAGGLLAGPVLTMKTAPGDNLLVHKAIAMGAPCDIIVVDAGGDVTNTILGEIVTAEAEAARIGGIVINGAIRDVASLRRSAFPVFAAGVTHRAPYKNGPGKINSPISIDGMVIEPDDLVLGDEDGILCIAYDDLDAVHAMATKKQADEEATPSAIRSGKPRDKSWVDKALAQLGCETMN